ncbi:MAG: glyoxylate/hydroxypyruvate reductase A [Thalassobium sp.]|nr:MAG: glyoxylate/hydroxypyruvate reductase A [Thalassobium sp.]
MARNILFSAPDHLWDDYKDALTQAFEQAGLRADLSRDHDPAVVDYIIYAPNAALTDFTPFTRCKAVLSLWAGVETIVTNDTLSQPLARLVDPGLTQGMVEWVVGHTLRHHLGMDTHIHGQDGIWRDHVPPLARDRPVTILGLGALGAACGQALANLGFPVTGWSRGVKTVEGITCLHGSAGLNQALTDAEILILLLPLTPLTHNLINAERIAHLAKGGFVINPGRGALIDDGALRAALDSGRIAHATLDVFRHEPLPADHPFWAHPKVTVTPHIASQTRPSSAANVIAQNIARCENGQPMKNLVNRKRGY